MSWRTKRYGTLAIGLLAAAFAVGAAARSEPRVAPPTPPAMVERTPMPTWLTGAWVEEKAGRWTEEYWSNARGDMMLGASKSGKASGMAAMFEHARIVRNGDGLPTFIAQPMGGGTSAFPMVTHDTGMIEFANAAHDFPQRIRYWREGATLRARIAMMDGGRAVEWTFRPMGSAQ